MKKPEKVLVIRNDKLGDFMLAWPAFSLLKTRFPDTEITALVPEYTAALARQCEWIDKVLIDTELPSSIKDILSLSSNIKNHQYDVSISLYSEARTSISLWLAGVKTRVGPATKLAQLFLNIKLRQKRSQSIKPEYEYNLDLVEFFIKCAGHSPIERQQPPFLKFDNTEILSLKNHYLTENSIDNNHKLVFIHPGSGGSAINLSLEQYAELALAIAKQNNVYIIITAGPGELEVANELSILLKETKHHVHLSTTGIIEFCKFINICDIFISGSTGPLHIAGALNVNTVAFYPARQSATSLRWQTINSNEKRLFFSPAKYTGQGDMKQIDISRSATTIIEHFIL